MRRVSARGGRAGHSHARAHRACLVAGCPRGAHRSPGGACPDVDAAEQQEWCWPAEHTSVFPGLAGEPHDFR